MTERRLPLRTWLAAGVLVFAMLALVAPAKAAPLEQLLAIEALTEAASSETCF